MHEFDWGWRPTAPLDHLLSVAQRPTVLGPVKGGAPPGRHIHRRRKRFGLAPMAEAQPVSLAGLARCHLSMLSFDIRRRIGAWVRALESLSASSYRPIDPSIHGRAGRRVPDHPQVPIRLSIPSQSNPLYRRS